MKPPVARKLCVTLTASFLATDGFKLFISKCMHDLQLSMLIYKYITVKMPLKGGVEIVMEIRLLIMENHGKIMELCF